MKKKHERQQGLDTKFLRPVVGRARSYNEIYEPLLVPHPRILIVIQRTYVMLKMWAAALRPL